MPSAIPPDPPASRRPGRRARRRSSSCCCARRLATTFRSTSWAPSIAILLAERQEAIKQSFAVQVFATDIDSQAIATARAGLYPASIAADISPQRLARFFTAEPGASAYRIHKSIRDLLVFSEQDVIQDL